MGDPKKPGNWKQETYEEKLPELRAKQLEGASQHLIGGGVSRSAVAEVIKGKVIIQGGLTGSQLLEALADVEEAEIFSLETLDSLRLCGWERAAPSPSWIWNSGLPSKVTLVNLYSCSGAKTSGIAISAMLDYWVPDIAGTAESIAGRPCNEDEQLALAAYQMASKMGLAK